MDFLSSLNDLQKQMAQTHQEMVAKQEHLLKELEAANREKDAAKSELVRITMDVSQSKQRIGALEIEILRLKQQEQEAVQAYQQAKALVEQAVGNMSAAEVKLSQSVSR
jgi:predicted  nucleic acid-binding Zn-ribbon protein